MRSCRTPRAIQVLHIHRTIPDTVQIGHFGRGGVDFGEFDASVLDHLHEIRRLSIDGLELIGHPEAID